MALKGRCKELVWIQMLLGEFGIMINRAIPIYEDNQSYAKLLDGYKIDKRMKHIET